MSPDPADLAAHTAARVREGVGWFPALDRGVLRVTGSDRVRWLNGMITADVASLVSGRCTHALLLSPKGRILCDLQVLERGDAFWLDTAADRVEDLRARLDRYVIADDVTLEDARDALWRASLEGPGTPDLLRALGAAAPDPGACTDAGIAGAEVVIAGFSEVGAPGVQLFVPRAAAPAVSAAVEAAGGDALVPGDARVLDVLRIEAGTPRWGSELDEDVLPAEAGLVARAVSLTKGCFTGQEIVARLQSRGQVNHRLVGLRFPDGEPAPQDAALSLADGKAVGEVTSTCRSTLGPIGLGYVRREHDAPGTRLTADGREVRVAALPFTDGSA